MDNPSGQTTLDTRDKKKTKKAKNKLKKMSYTGSTKTKPEVSPRSIE